MIDLEDVGLYSVIAIFCGMVLFVLYVLFYLVPIKVSAQETCYKQGYPEVRVDWKGNSYCVTMYEGKTIPRR